MGYEATPTHPVCRKIWGRLARWAAGARQLEPEATRGEADPVDRAARGDVQRRAVATPGHVGRGDIELEAAEVGAVGREDVDAAGPCREEIALGIDLHALGCAL